MAKYDSNRKIHRNKLLVEYVQQNPELSLQEVGMVFNISRQRVSEILQREKNKATETNSVALP